MRAGAAIDGGVGATGQRTTRRERVVRGDDGQAQQQEQPAALAAAFDIERQMKDIESDVDAIERIGDPERPAISEPQIRIPLRKQRDREKQRYAAANEPEGAFQNDGERLDEGGRVGVAVGPVLRTPPRLKRRERSAPPSRPDGDSAKGTRIRR